MNTQNIDIVRKISIISDMSTVQAIKNAIADKPVGAVYACADFLSAGSRAAIDQALFRMMKAGTIKRVARGLYAAAGQPVDIQTVANAIAQKTGERMGLSPPGFSGDVWRVPTSGQSRTLKATGLTVQFRRMSQRKVQLAASPNGRVLLHLWTQGMNNLTTLEIQRATGGWSQGDVERYAGLIPAWLLVAVQQANAPRKSVKIGLTGAYDWSNPNIKDEVLIGKVLEKHKFEDVARLCFYYGVRKVKRAFKQQSFEPMTTASVARMLRNISRGLRSSEGKAGA
jgi:hypothetical protein